MSLTKKAFSFPVRVYYEDTDAGGVVYHARYLHFFERARTEYLRQKAFSQQELLQQQRLAFVVRSMNIEFCLAAKLDDWLVVETELSEVKGATMIFTQQLKRDEILLCEAKVKIACVNLEKMKPVAIPMQIKQEFLTNK